MQITCSKCQKIYTVDSGKIPPKITSTRCKTCGNVISLRPAAQQSSPQDDSQTPLKAPSDIMQITCQYCSRQFKIRSKAIPKDVTSTRCKACGHLIAL
ncbi:MAG: zinc-ribbon domain-containing protein, partial [Desulfobacterales bacterium]